jgi:hypothetical protein
MRTSGRHRLDAAAAKADDGGWFAISSSAADQEG